jgi:hypothetical protein
VVPVLVLHKHGQDEQLEHLGGHAEESDQHRKIQGTSRGVAVQGHQPAARWRRQQLTACPPPRSSSTTSSDSRRQAAAPRRGALRHRAWRSPTEVPSPSSPVSAATSSSASAGDRARAPLIVCLL